MKEQIENFFNESASVGIVPGLSRIRALLQIINDPQDKLNFIHIAGTNGKGSTGCYCNALLASAGYRVGWFSTPHLVRRSESIRVTDGLSGLGELQINESAGEIDEISFVNIVEKLKLAEQTMKSQNLGQPSEFELMTAAAILHFAREDCDYVIWETGMGGTGDATNVIKKPSAVIITAIGYDHSAWLGDNVLAIAEQKAGIIKRDCPVWLYDPYSALEDKNQAEELLVLFEQKCQALNAKLNVVGADDLEVIEHNIEGQTFCETSGKCHRIRQSGSYQPLLALLSIAVCRYITDRLELTDQQEQALSAAVWPARFELVQRQTSESGPVILDGAHNPQGCRALADSLAKIMPEQRIIFLTGILADKEVEKMLSHVFCTDRYRCGPIICTEPHNKRAMPALELARRIAKITGRKAMSLPISPDNSYNNSDLVLYENDSAKATAYALALNRQPLDAICVFGSLYLAGAVRDQLLNYNYE